MAPQTDPPQHHRLSMALVYVVLVTTVAAPVAVGAGVVAARLVEPGDVFAVTLAVAVVCGLVIGMSAAPDLRRRIGRPAAARSRIGRGSSAP